jgi:hypothetical protein
VGDGADRRIRYADVKNRIVKAAPGGFGGTKVRRDLMRTLQLKLILLFRSVPNDDIKLRGLRD